MAETKGPVGPFVFSDEAFWFPVGAPTLKLAIRSATSARWVLSSWRVDCALENKEDLLAIGRAKMADGGGDHGNQHTGGKPAGVFQNNRPAEPVSTRAEIAKIANVSPGTVARWERGQGMIYDEFTADPNALHPVEYIEPIEESDNDEAIALVRRLIDSCLLSEKRPLKDRLEAGFRNWASLVSIVRPEALGHASQVQIAEALGCAPGLISKRAIRWSDLLGIRSRTMKPQRFRDSHRALREGKKGIEKVEGRGSLERHHDAMQRHTEDARDRYRSGKNWTSIQRVFLKTQALIDDADKLTAKGRDWIAEGAMAWASHDKWKR
jgi:transcriptional regulator with XRE-family HTH domain